MHTRSLWQLFALPGVLWLLLFFVVPFYAIMAVAFGTVDPVFQNPIPVWNPLEWNYDDALRTLGGFLPGNTFWRVVVRTTKYVAAALILCLLIGYPVAYYISRHAGRMKSLLLILLILPFWVSYLMRMLAWVNLLAPEGYVNRILVWTGLTTNPPAWLDGNPYSVILALTYGYIPYLILPLLAALDRIDKSLLEAARDLGASPLRTFIHVTLPLSKTGVLGASVIVLLPMFGDYYTPNIVSGSPQTSMLGNQIDIYFHGGPQPAVGATLTLILSLFLGILMAYYTYTIAKTSREVRT